MSEKVKRKPKPRSYSRTTIKIITLFSLGLITYGIYDFVVNFTICIAPDGACGWAKQFEPVNGHPMCIQRAEEPLIAPEDIPSTPVQFHPKWPWQSKHAIYALNGEGSIYCVLANGADRKELWGDNSNYYLWRYPMPGTNLWQDPTYLTNHETYETFFLNAPAPDQRSFVRNFHWIQEDKKLLFLDSMALGFPASYTIRLWDSETTENYSLTSTTSYALSMDGRHMASMSWDSGISQIRVTDLYTREVTRTISLPGSSQFHRSYISWESNKIVVLGDYESRFYQGEEQTTYGIRCEIQLDDAEPYCVDLNRPDDERPR